MSPSSRLFTPALSPRDAPFLRVRRAETGADMQAVLRLRARMFGPSDAAGDDVDADCTHLVVAARGGGLVGCCRVQLFDSGRQIGRSYAARHYRLERLQGYRAPLAEVGRFCLRPGAGAADAARLLWGQLVAICEARGVRLLFGCSSFAGRSVGARAPALAWLGKHRQGPARWRPGRKAPAVVPLAAAGPEPDRRSAMRAMPALLRSYLAMGAWVGDHAVIDPELDTLHVFTALPVSAIPPARLRFLRKALGAGAAAAGPAAAGRWRG